MNRSVDFAKVGDAVGRGPARGLGGAADDGGYLGVGQSGQVVVGDREPLSFRQPGQRPGQIQVPAVGAAGANVRAGARTGAGATTGVLVPVGPNRFMAA